MNSYEKFLRAVVVVVEARKKFIFVDFFSHYQENLLVDVDVVEVVRAENK